MAFGGYLRQSTAVDVLIGPFLDETTGKDIEAGLTIEDEHVLLSKNGQALAAKNDANNAANDGGTAYYNCPLDDTNDTDTVGQLTITCHISGALPIRLDYQVMAQVPFDELFKNAAAGMQGVIELNNLDHLLKVTTGVNADGDLSNHVIDKTVMSHLLTATADTDKFKASTDSLEAIKVHADTIKTEADKIGTIPALDGGAQTIGAAIAKLADDNAGADFDAGTDSLQEIRDHIGNGTNLTDVGLATNSVDADALNADAVDEILDEEVDNDGTAITLRGAIKLILSILTAKSSGGGGATIVFRDINDSKNRISATVDANGNRTAVGTRDAT